MYYINFYIIILIILVWPKNTNAQSVTVIINEIMADPEPVLGLPAVEYVELKNAGSGPVELEGYQWKDRSSQSILGSCRLAAGEILILCAMSDTALFSGYGRVMGLHPWPRLNNSDDDLELWSSRGLLVDRLSYSSSWYGNTKKDDGGYSLERINDFSWCGSEGNWGASNSATGGSPGEENSISSIDHSAPKLVKVIAEDSVRLRLDFDETVSPSSNPRILIEPEAVVSETSIGPGNEIIVNLGTALQGGIRYRMELSHVTDCSGNLAFAKQQKFFYLPEDPEPGDVVINEILFDPFPGGSDFVEIYNQSDLHINLRDWQIGNFSDSLVSVRVLTEEDFILSPGDHVVLSRDPADIKFHYPKSKHSRFLECSLPTLSNEMGSFAIADADGVMHDSITYHSDHHYTLLLEVEGVSLERIDPRAESMDHHNWMSAAESVGFASPGFLNSQSAPAHYQQAEIQIEPELILPQHDGNQDYTQIIYNFPKGGNVANVRIFDLKGNIIRHLVRGQYLGRSGFFTWDGTDWRSRRVKSGHYLISVEVFHDDGSQNTWLGKVSVAPRF